MAHGSGKGRLTFWQLASSLGAEVEISVPRRRNLLKNIVIVTVGTRVRHPRKWGLRREGTRERCALSLERYGILHARFACSMEQEMSISSSFEGASFCGFGALAKPVKLKRVRI